MSTNLASYVDSTVTVITNDGRHIVGTLRGYDQTNNLILDECHERLYREEEGVESIALGLYVIRGDNVGVVGEMDEDLDSQIDLALVKAAPLKPVRH